MVDIDSLMRYEQGEMDFGDMIDMFQKMIDSGEVWVLQGSYGRTAAALIESGHCQRKGQYEN